MKLAILLKSSLKSKDSLYNLITNSQMEEILSLTTWISSYCKENKDTVCFIKPVYTSQSSTILALLLSNIHIYQKPETAAKNEKEIRRLTSIAEEANEIKSHFLTNMSYNIRILLNNVLGFSQLMTGAELNEKEKREYSGIIRKQLGWINPTDLRIRPFTSGKQHDEVSATELQCARVVQRTPLSGADAK